MRFEWKSSQCLLCLRPETLTDEHVIPDSLLGKLVAKLLCVDCNSGIGTRVEKDARRDPSIATEIRRFADAFPDKATKLLPGLPVIAVGAGGPLKAHLKGDGVVVHSQPIDDGGFVHGSPVAAARHVEAILVNQGIAGAPLKELLDLVDSAPLDQPVPLPGGYEFVRRSTGSIETDTGQPALNPLIPLKIAYEFLAGHAGDALLKDVPQFAAIRRILLGGEEDPEVATVVALIGESDRPIHGILFEAGRPHVTIQVRLFGRLAYRVHFHQLSYDAERLVYTQDLASGLDGITRAKF